MIPTNDSGRAIQNERNQIEAAINRVLSSGHLILGRENEALSSELGQYLDIPNVILVGNGTDAIEIALTSIGIQPNQIVLTVANAGGYSTSAISRIGARPVYVDIDENYLQMSVDGPVGLKKVLKSLNEAPAAVIVTHLYGKAAPVREILEVLEPLGIPMIEDCAQSLGARINGKMLGTFGLIGTTSFYPTKNLGALGDGGALFTSDPDVAMRARALRQYGWTTRYHSTFSGGGNSRLDEIQAAILRFRLQELDGHNKRRGEIFRRYSEIEGDGVVVHHKVGEDFVAHLAIASTDNRDKARGHFHAKEIQTDIHYPVPDHKQASFHYQETYQLPVTEAMSERIFSIPLFPEMSEEEIEAVMGAIQSYNGRKK